MSGVDDVTVVIKTFIRPVHVKRLIESIRTYYPDIKIIVVNDGDDKDVYEDENMKTIILPFNVGLSAGRNSGVAAVETEYFVLCDDDFVFTDKTDVVRWRELLVKYGFDILGSQLEDTFSPNRWTWIWDEQEGKIYEKNATHTSTKDNGFVVAHVDFCLNTFIARTKVIQEHPWDEKYKIMEHRPYFYKYRNDLKVGWTEEIFMGHTPDNSSSRYDSFRRGKDQSKYYAYHKQDGFNFTYTTKNTDAKNTGIKRPQRSKKRRRGR